MADYLDALALAREPDPMQRVALAGRKLGVEFELDALTVTLATAGPGIGHRVVYAHGYCADNLEYFCDTLVTHDPRYRELVDYGAHAFGWEDPDDFVESHAAVNWLIPAGYRDGASLCLRDESGHEIGAIHTNTRVAGWNDARADSLAAFVEFASETLRPVHRWNGFRLTQREVLVARLVTEGASNPQIAQELFLSRSTVKTHIENIIAKLGVDSRVGIAVVMTQYGMR